MTGGLKKWFNDWKGDRQVIDPGAFPGMFLNLTAVSSDDTIETG